jgi:hypothetical protein
MANNKLSENKPIIITFLVVVVAIAVMIGYFITSSEPEPVAIEVIAIPEPEPVVEQVIEEIPEPVVLPDVEIPEPAPIEEPAFVLPLLDNSDPLTRDGVISLTRHEGINAWLAPNELIRKFVAFVDNIAHGQVAKEPVRFLAPEGLFLANPLDENTFELNTSSYDRYNRFTEIVVSVDARRSAEFYHLLLPLIQSAYDELGYGNKSFDEVLFQAIGRLLETPVIDGQIRLVRPVVMYKFEDERLESLNAAQKQMIRMGPRNTRMLQAKLSEVALELRAILEND